MSGRQSSASRRATSEGQNVSGARSAASAAMAARTSDPLGIEAREGLVAAAADLRM